MRVAIDKHQATRSVAKKNLNKLSASMQLQTEVGRRTTSVLHLTKEEQIKSAEDGFRSLRWLGWALPGEPAVRRLSWLAASFGRLGTMPSLCSKHAMKTRKNFVDPIFAVIFAAFLIGAITAIAMIAI